ncbi:hypothetical protein C8F01DRAFT_1124844 [Mycena amicta]|nr:hypothetical protein C8F01DRAFT_1124844 [Mycena amicta]
MATLFRKLIARASCLSDVQFDPGDVNPAENSSGEKGGFVQLWDGTGQEMKQPVAPLEHNVHSEQDQDAYDDFDLRFMHLWDGTAQQLRKQPVADSARILRIGPYFVCDALDATHHHPFQDTARLTGSVLSQLRHIIEYHLRWHERPTMSLLPGDANSDMSTLALAATFLKIPFSAAPYLRTLDVELSLDKAQQLFSPDLVLPCLDNFRLCIRHEGNATCPEYVMENLSRFLNNHHSTLLSLSFETSLSADFSCFFATLGPLEKLSTLVLCIPTAKPHLGDPSAVKGFLQLHCSFLEHISIRAFRVHPTLTCLDATWLSQCLSGVAFPVLRTLDVRTSFLPLDVVMKDCVGQWADTLTRLDISGEYLSLEQAEKLVMLAGPHLRDLAFYSCPEALTTRLPPLTKLTLRIRGVAPQRSGLVRRRAVRGYGQPTMQG